MIITLRNEQIIAEVNTLGGAIESLRDANSGEEHSWPYDAAVWPRRTSICFPICSLLENGTYTHLGQTYTMPMHGFLRECDMQVISQKEDHAVFAFESNEWSKAMYPFDFRFELEQHLDGRSLVVDYHITNTGDEALPFSVGSHYPYLLPGPQKTCCFLFSEEQHAGRLVMHNGVVAHKTADVLKGARLLSMDGLFDDGASIFERSDLTTESVSIGTDGKSFTRVESEGFPYLVLWGKKDEAFACIETWAGMADYAGHDSELLHKKGIQIAQPGHTLSFRQRITIC